VAFALVAPAACGGGGGGGGTPTSPSTPPDVPAGTLITITGSGVSPKSLTVPQGTRVTFFNNSNTVHDMSSDPHPNHTDCPEINQAGFLTPGQSRATGNLNTRRTCGFHDHNRDTDTSLQGTIVIQ
jgi:plastocyanin